MSRRNENIRKSCDEIDDITETVKLLLLPTNSWQAIGILNLIKKYTHRIKRTTWRGEKATSSEERCPLCGGIGIHITQHLLTEEQKHKIEVEKAVKHLSSLPTKPSAKKDKWDKDWEKYNNLAKRINTNQTTTANIDVSTIPYY